MQRTYKAVVKREVPAATDELPSMALSTAGGGRIATDPQAEGQRAFQTMFQFDLEILDDVSGDRIGQRVFVRFDHGWEPLAYRWYRTARRLFLRKFSV
jgi:putative peptide zinc metalloprotease protein